MSIARSLHRLRACGAPRATTAIAIGVLMIVSSGCGEADVPAPPPPLRLTLPTMDELSMRGPGGSSFGLALAPDGRRLAIAAAADDGHARLWLHDLATGAREALPGTESAVLPFWSPDGRELGFFADRQMRALQVETGARRDLADAAEPSGAVWLADGAIVFAPGADRGLSIRRGDGQVEAFTTLDRERETAHVFPDVVSDGRAIVFYVRATDTSRQGIWIANLSAPEERRRLVSSPAHAVAAPGALLYASGAALVAQRLAPETQTLEGRPILVSTEVGHADQHLFATAGGDVVIHAPATSRLRQLQWRDRTGTPLGSVGEPMDAWSIRASPRGDRVAVARVDPQLNTLDVWIYDAGRPVPRRLSPSINIDESPVWSPDGASVAWVSARRTVTVRASDADRPEAAVRTFDHPVQVGSWSPDRAWLVVAETRPATGSDLVLLPAPGARGREMQDYAAAPFNQIHGSVSPDGRWMAYTSDESGAFEVYVDAFPAPGRRARITVGGGTEPRWTAGGREIIFRRGSALHAARLSFDASLPEAVSTTMLFDTGTDLRAFDISRDGSRVLLNLPAPGVTRRQTSVLVGLDALLAPPRVETP